MDSSSLTLVTGRLRNVAHVIDLQRVHGDLFGAVINEVEFSAFIQGAPKLSLPLGRIGFIHSLLELPGLHGPRLKEKSDGDRLHLWYAAGFNPNPL